jgi:hypothetical protein
MGKNEKNKTINSKINTATKKIKMNRRGKAS